MQQIVIKSFYPFTARFTTTFNLLRDFNFCPVRQKIIAVFRIRVISMDKNFFLVFIRIFYFLILPFRRSPPIKKDIIILSQHRDSRQIIHIRFCEIFFQRPAAISIDSNFRRIVKSHLLQFRISEFVDSILLNLYFHPVSFAQYRVIRIPFTGLHRERKTEAKQSRDTTYQK